MLQICRIGTLAQRISGPVVVTNFATALSSSPWDLVFARADASIFTTIEVGVRRTGRAALKLKLRTARFGLRTSTSMVVKMRVSRKGFWRLADESLRRRLLGFKHSATPEFVLWLISNCALALSMALSRRSLNASGAHSKSRFEEFLTRLTAAQLSSPWHHLNEL